MAEEVSAAKAAQLTDRNEKTIRRHIADGSLSARKTHYSWLITTDELRRRYGAQSLDSADETAKARKQAPEFREEAEFEGILWLYSATSDTETLADALAED